MGGHFQSPLRLWWPLTPRAHGFIFYIQNQQAPANISPTGCPTPFSSFIPTPSLVNVLGACVITPSHPDNLGANHTFEFSCCFGKQPCSKGGGAARSGGPAVHTAQHCAQKLQDHTAMRTGIIMTSLSWMLPLLLWLLIILVLFCIAEKMNSFLGGGNSQEFSRD